MHQKQSPHKKKNAPIHTQTPPPAHPHRVIHIDTDTDEHVHTGADPLACLLVAVVQAQDELLEEPPRAAAAVGLAAALRQPLAGLAAGEKRETKVGVEYRCREG